MAWFMDRVVPQSFATFSAPGRRCPTTLPKTYVAATGYSPTRFAQYAEAGRGQSRLGLRRTAGRRTG